MDSLTRIRLVKYCEKMQIQKSEAIRKAIDFLTDDNEVEDGKNGNQKSCSKYGRYRKSKGVAKDV